MSSSPGKVSTMLGEAHPNGCECAECEQMISSLRALRAAPRLFGARPDMYSEKREAEARAMQEQAILDHLMNQAVEAGVSEYEALRILTWELYMVPELS